MITLERQSVSELQVSDPFELIETAARICFNSEDKKQPGKSESFVRGLIKRGHLTPLEHAYVRIYLDLIEEGPLRSYSFCLHNFAAPGDYPFADRRLTRGAFYRGQDDEKGPYVAGNVRDIVWYFKHHVDPIDYLKEVKAELDPNYAVLLLTTDRGIATEFFRHRTMSYDDDGNERGYKSLEVDFVPEPSINQQSTRYVNFTKKDVSLILPEPAEWAYDPTTWQHSMWHNTCEYSLKIYQNMVESGMTPEYARNVLPLSLGTKVIMSGSVLNWLYVLNLRLPKGAHPQARLLSSYIWYTLWNNHREYIKGILEKEKLDQEFQCIDFAAEAREIQKTVKNPVVQEKQ